MSGDEDTDTPDTNSKASEGAVEGTIKAATGLVKAVPIYQDAIQPAAKELARIIHGDAQVWMSRGSSAGLTGNF